VNGLDVHQSLDDTILQKDTVASADISGHLTHLSGCLGAVTLSSSDLTDRGLALIVES
jgi:hypothetical protein